MKKISSSLILLLLLVGIGKVQGQVYVLQDAGQYKGNNLNKLFSLTSGKPLGELSFQGSTDCASGAQKIMVQETVNGVESAIIYTTTGLPGSWGTTYYTCNNLSRNATQIRFTSVGGCFQYIRNVSVTMASYLESTTTSINSFNDATNVLEKTFDVSHSNTAAISVSSNNANFVVISPTNTFGGSGLHGSQTVTIGYSPQSLGTHNGIITVTDGTKTVTVNVQGESSIVAPSNVRSTSQNYTSLDFAWDAVANATDYSYELLQSGVLKASGTTTTLTQTVSSLIPNTLYQFRVKANFAAATSAFNTVNASTLNMTPQNIQTSEITEQSFQCSWNTVVGVDGYEINVYKTSDNSLVKSDRTADLNYTITGLTKGTNYYCTVSAYSVSVVSQPSSNINVMTSIYLPIVITQTTGINYEWITNNNVTTTWTTNGYELKQSSATTVVQFNDIPLSYTTTLFVRRGTATVFDTYPTMYVECSSNGTAWTTILHTFSEGNPSNAQTSVQKTFSGTFTAAQQASRYFRIRCEGNDPNTNGYVQKIEINPVTITALEATNVVGDSFTAKWQLVSGATDYQVSVYQKNGDGTTTTVENWLAGNVDNYDVAGLNPYYTYYYQVKAVFPSGQTKPSNEIKVVTMVTPEVEGATEVTGTSFMANWKELSGVTGYYINVYKASDHSLVVGNQIAVAIDTSKIIVGLHQGTEYYYTVSAFVTIASDDVISLPVVSPIFTTATTDENLGLNLTYTTPTDIYFWGNSKELIYSFSDVAGQFIFSTILSSGSHNGLNPNKFQVYESADKTTWNLLKTYNSNSFNNSNEVLGLSKTTRYIKLVFTKTWSCDAGIGLKAGAKITKALELTPAALANFSDANGITTNTFTVKYSNIHTALNVVASSHFSVSPTTITPDASGTGSATVTVTFNPNGVQSYNEQIKVEDSGYTTNFGTVTVSGVARIQPVTGLKAENITFTAMGLTWDNVGADEYLLTVTPMGSTTAVLETTTTENSYTLTNLLPSTIYNINVIAHYGTKFSAPATLQIPTLNNIPEILGAEEVMGNSFKATWKPLTTGITGYYINVYNADGTPFITDQQTTDTAIVISGLNPGISYYYTVRSYFNIDGSNTNQLISVPKSSDIFTTLATDNLGNVLLPYTVSSNIVFSSSKDVIYQFSSVPGTFTFSLNANSGSGNGLNPNSLAIYESEDGNTWAEKVKYIAGYTNHFTQNDIVLDLDKTTRYLKLSFIKTWSCDAQVTLKTGSVISKALTVSPNALTGFSDADNITKKTFAVNYSNINEVLTVTAPAGFSVNPTEITATGTGNANVEVTFSTTAAGSYSGQVRVERKNYTEDFTTLTVSGIARVQPVTGLKTTHVDLTSFSLAWDNITADEYLLTVATTETSEQVFTGTIVGTQTQYTVENLLPNTSYIVSIKAKFGAKPSTATTLVVSTKNITDQPQPVEIKENPTFNEVLRHNMTLSDITFSGGLAKDSYGNTIEGVFTFKEPNMVLKQGENCELVVVFQPTSEDFLRTEFSISVNVLKGLQAIVWTQKESLSELTIDTVVLLTATAGSGLAVHYVSSNTDVAEVVDNNLVVKTAGTITLTAEQVGNEDFEAAESVIQSIVIKSETTGGDEDDDPNTSVSKPLMVNIYPNPVKSTLFISGIDIESVELLTVQGQTLCYQKFGQPKRETTVDMGAFPTGIYFVKIVSESQVVVQTVTLRK